MPQPMTSSPTKRSAARFALLALTMVVALGVLIGSAAATSKAPKKVTKTVAKKANNATLGKVVLISVKNRTLYTLSDEVRGKFSCVDACLDAWPPLIVGKNVKPRGPAALSRIKRPDGRFQVTFRGRPLYTFVSDTAAGQATGDGVLGGSGTWRAASLGTISAQPESAPAPAPTPGAYPYPY
jgi:predicted lipoprotein with Yx(FWY)xxD motif